jgi:hypothetical protein
MNKVHSATTYLALIALVTAKTPNIPTGTFGVERVGVINTSSPQCKSQPKRPLKAKMVLKILSA